jgi:serine/threonine protein kinase/Tol biopolymer transport system component
VCLTPERWRKISAVYHAALAQPTAHRGAYVVEACTDDASLRREVEDLLASESKATAFLRLPLAEIALGSTDNDSLVGARIGPYRVQARLGAGGMGQVYRARDSKLGRDVAIKILPAAFTTDPERLARFEREARALAALNHPHIGAIYGLEEHAGAPALVLELAEGTTLADRLEKGSSLAIAEALRLAIQVADALDAAHERGIVHRDLKPANIAITIDGIVKVLDFGLAKASADPEAAKVSDAPTIALGQTQHGVIVGTAGYMSPEQARGQRTDKRTDIWAFGCVLYEMFAGREAFPGDTVNDVIAAVLEREPDWALVSPAVPPSVVRLMRRCLEKDPRRRLRDIGDARIELEATPEPPPVVPVWTPLRVWIPWSIAAVAVAAAGLVSVLGRTDTAPTTAPVFPKVMSLASGPALEFGPAIAPDGKWVTYLSNAGGKVGLWVKFLNGGDATNLTVDSALELPSRIDIGGPTVSPDGTLIAFDAGAAPQTPSNLFDSWVISAPGGGVPRKLVEGGRATRWSPDGSRIAYVRPGAAAGDALYIADADATNERLLLPVRGGMHVHWPTWAYDGRWIYYVSSPNTANSEPAEIHRISADGGTPEVIVKTARRAVSPAALPDGRGLLYAGNPYTAHLGLWWVSLDGARLQLPMTSAVGEYGELAVARDGQSLVATFADVRQSLVRVAVDDRSAQLMVITDGSTGDIDPSMSLQGDRLVFSSTRGGNRSIWASGPDGRNARPLTGGASLDERPEISPDGGQVAFVADRRGERAIWVMQADGGAPRQVVAAPVLDRPSWSPNSRQLVYATPVDEAPGLSIVDVGTGSVRRLSTPGPANSPVWSPGADLIAYIEARPSSPRQANSSRVAFVTSNGTPVNPGLRDSPNLLNGFLAWAPDGHRIAAVVEPGALPGALWVLDSLGKQPSRRVAQLPVGVRMRGATWSPDSRHIFLGQTERSSDVVLFQQ